MTKQSYKERRDEILAAVYEKGWQDAGGKPTEDFNPISQEEAAEAIDSLLLDTAMEAKPETQECDYHGEGEEDSCVGCAAASENNKCTNTYYDRIKQLVGGQNGR